MRTLVARAGTAAKKVGAAIKAAWTKTVGGRKAN